MPALTSFTCNENPRLENLILHGATAVLVDGTPMAAETAYRFASVSQNHTISAQFIPPDVPLPPDETGVSKNLNTMDR